MQIIKVVSSLVSVLLPRVSPPLLPTDGTTPPCLAVEAEEEVCKPTLLSLQIPVTLDPERMGVHEDGEQGERKTV
ncbi:hypothetical protein NQZ68_029303 [Dissostichus eleginoides]|nr:hypothetical protein NQZ68_029303 [Dissostichus eleginoides]